MLIAPWPIIEAKRDPGKSQRGLAINSFVLSCVPCLHGVSTGCCSAAAVAVFIKCNLLSRQLSITLSVSRLRDSNHCERVSFVNYFSTIFSRVSLAFVPIPGTLWYANCTRESRVIGTFKYTRVHIWDRILEYRLCWSPILRAPNAYAVPSSLET